MYQLALLQNLKINSNVQSRFGTAQSKCPNGLYGHVNFVRAVTTTIVWQRSKMIDSGDYSDEYTDLDGFKIV